MITLLKIKNLAILENIEVTFNPGFTVLTGETGAGKSLILDALSLLLGERASTEVIRSNEDSAYIQAIFEPVPEAIKIFLEETFYDEHQLIIERTIYKDKGNQVRINGHIVPLNTLRNIAPHLADLHGQDDTRTLLKPIYYPSLLDQNHLEIHTVKISYQEALNDYKEAVKKLKEFQTSLSNMDKEKAFMAFQLEELDAFNPSIENEEALKETVYGLENYDQLFNHLKTIYDGFKRGSISEIESLRPSFTNLSDIKSDESFKERFESVMIELNDLEMTVSDLLDDISFDPYLLESSQNRLALYERLKRKHHLDTAGLVFLRDSLSHQLSQLENGEDTEKQLKKDLEVAKKRLLDHASKLDILRKEVALNKTKEITDLLTKMALDDALFEITFENLEVSQMTQESPSAIDFLITTNKGEPKRPLHKTASGGELSRIMLAIKMAFLSKEQISSLILDEIDTGVSGKVASQVGVLLRQLGESIQVIAITHLPQVAAKGHHHYYVEKHVENDRTKASLNPLLKEERIRAIASMLSDGSLTKEQLESARQLMA
jgi:DNA repair protein RecN (Recombination protein N)